MRKDTQEVFFRALQKPLKIQWKEPELPLDGDNVVNVGICSYQLEPKPPASSWKYKNVSIPEPNSRHKNHVINKQGEKPLSTLPEGRVTTSSHLARKARIGSNTMSNRTCVGGGAGGLKKEKIRFETQSDLERDTREKKSHMLFIVTFSDCVTNFSKSPLTICEKMGFSSKQKGERGEIVDAARQGEKQHKKAETSKSIMPSDVEDTVPTSSNSTCFLNENPTPKRDESDSQKGKKDHDARA